MRASKIKPSLGQEGLDRGVDLMRTNKMRLANLKDCLDPADFGKMRYLIISNSRI